MSSSPLMLVTGASGFVGRILCRELAKRGIRYRAVVRNKTEGYAEFALGSFDEATDWSGALRNCQIVMHLAARAHVLHETSANSLEEFRRTNLHATVHLARSAALNGVRRFVYVSSIGVNGLSTARSSAFTENDAANPHSAYALSKWEAECALREIEADTGLEVVIVRPPLVYGADAPGNFALMLKVLKYGLPLPFGSVENLRSFIYVENLVDALILCAQHANAAGHTYVLADDEQVSTPDLLRKIGAAIGKPVKLFGCRPVFLQALGRAAGKTDMVHRLLDSLRVDNGKIRSHLGWTPPYTLDEGLDVMAGEAQKNEKIV